MEKEHHILIVGGGFAGIATARRLVKENLKNTHITLVSNKKYFEYYPALYRIVTCASPIEVCVPLEDIISQKVEIVVDTITSIDNKQKIVHGTDGMKYKYDTLVLSLGSEANYFDLPGVSELAFSFKSINDALILKNHIYKLFEEHLHPDMDEKVSHYHVVIVGAGPSGVELAGDLVAFMKRIARKMKTDPSLVTIDIIEAAPRLLPALPPDVSEKVLKRLQKMGVNIFLNRSMVREEVEHVYLKDMSFKAKTVIWTAGTKINHIYTENEIFQLSPRKRVIVDDYLRVPSTDIFVLGDGAQTKYTGLAQTALYDGNFVGKTIARILNKKPLKIYNPKQVAFAIPVGDDWGVFSMGKIRLYGRLAYLIRQVIDFIFFAGILPLRKVLGLFWDGYKYRKENSLKGYRK